MGGFHMKSVRLEFLRFDGEEPIKWLYRANQFFTFNQTSPQHKLFMASFHMEGKALMWFREVERSGGITSWEAFERAVLIKFGHQAYDYPMRGLVRLRQTGTVEEYTSRFEVLANHLGGLDEAYKLSCYLSGLKNEIRLSIKMLNPNNIQRAFALANLEEECLVVGKKTARAGSNNFSSPPTCGHFSRASTKPNVRVQCISP